MKVVAVGPHRSLWETLLERAREAQHVAQAENRRSRLLVAFLAPFRKEPEEFPVECAWCGRAKARGEWVPDDFLAHGVPAWLDGRTSHGICPDCLDRQMRSTSK